MNLVTADEPAIRKAAEMLRQGKLVAIPTETVYGLGADAKNPEAVKRIFAAKGRPSEHPLIVHLPDKSALTDWAVDIPVTAYKLAERFWPGPLTLVLKKHHSVPYEVTGGQDTVALRVPNHPVALSVLRAFGGGIAAPSANRYCRISPTQACHVAEELGDMVDMILDGGECQVGLESTIIDLSTGQPKILRPGQISVLEIEAVLQIKPELQQDSNVRAPGMHEVHYAPATPTALCNGEEIEGILSGGTFPADHNFGILAYSSDFKSDKVRKIIVMPKSAAGYAHSLYASLRLLDHEAIDVILIEQPPQSEEWWAINNRLAKAGGLRF